MRRVRFAIGALALLWMAPLRAQEPVGTIRGTVTDDATKEPLAGVTLTFGGHRSVSQADGRYLITLAPAGTDSLRARMLGYAPLARSVTVMAGDTTVADVSMSAVAVGLSEIVVIGYGQERAGDATSSITQLSPMDFNPVTPAAISPQLLIEDKVAGVQIVDNNEPGGGLSIKIRGAASLTASSQPLYVVDGVPLGAGGGISAGRDPLNFLNSADIENVTVLKDASAAAIYGTNASNGVVIITTKRGRGAPQIEYSGSMSAQSVSRTPSMLNAAQFRTAVDSFAPANVAQLGPVGTNTNWFNLITRTGWGQEHNLVVSGTGQTNNYRLSVGWLKQNGIIDNSSNERLSIGFNYDQRLFHDQLTVKTNLKGSRSIDNFVNGDLLGQAAQMGPTQPVYDSTTATGYYNYTVGGIQSPYNPVEILALTTQLGYTYRSVGNVQLAYTVPYVDGLTANLNLGYDVTKVTNQNFASSLTHHEQIDGDSGYVNRSDNTQINTLLEAYLDYAAPLRLVPGNIDVTGGYSYAPSHSEYAYYGENNLTSNQYGINAFPAAKYTQQSLNVTDAKLISFFGRVNYNLNDRYIAAFSIRRDGSSRFAPSNAWANFPSVSGAWRISEEPFMKGISQLSDLKLRASWAVTGNQSFGDFLYSTIFTPGNNQAEVQFGNQFIPTVRPSAVDPNIKWEQTAATNFGVDFGFLNQRISGSIDYYFKTTKDVIFDVPIDPATNLSNHLVTNIGRVKNNGLEFSLSARILQGGGNHLGYTADFTASHNVNKIAQITPWGGTSAQIPTGSIAGGVGSFAQVWEANEPINSFLVCRQFYDSTGKPVQGKFYYAGADSTFTTAGTCDSRGLRAYHTPDPTWILGHTSYFTYGNFDFSFSLRAWIGNYVYNNVASNTGTYSQLKLGSPYNLSTSVLKTGFTSQQLLSDIYVEDGSFLRMDNISLGYNFKWQGRQLRLSLTVQNVFTITGYSGVDPTAGYNGIDNNIYPRSRTVTGGLTVKF